jgi:acetylornithine deacetylase/succinyl-diaminopimelate desuccinylase-like protein
MMPMLRRIRDRLIAPMAFAVFALATTQAYAAGSNMPWELPLTQILDSIQGPVAKVISVIVIIVTGVTLAFGGWDWHDPQPIFRITRPSSMVSIVGRLNRFSTVNVGSIRGGTQPNIVPAQCEISVDRRTIPGETEAGVRREIKSLLVRRRLKARLINTKDAPCLPLETDASLPLVQQLFRAAGQRKPVGVDFFCDAAVLASGGIPSVVFGPGDIAQAHTADEWISLRSLERATAILLRFLQSLP